MKNKFVEDVDIAPDMGHSSLATTPLSPTSGHSMRRNTDLTRAWKIPMPATLAGRVELAIADPVTHQPKYGVRTHLIVALLENYMARELGAKDIPPVPSIEQLRSM